MIYCLGNAAAGKAYNVADMASFLQAARSGRERRFSISAHAWTSPSLMIRGITKTSLYFHDELLPHSSIRPQSVNSCERLVFPLIPVPTSFRPSFVVLTQANCRVHRRHFLCA
jgi:hypothetical protein